MSISLSENEVNTLKGKFFVSLLILMCLVGCGGDEEDEYREPVSFVSASPPGGEIYGNTTITLIFDGEPTDVSVSAGTVTVAGKTATIWGPFTPGPLALTITWADGIQALNYTVTPPDNGSGGPPIIGGTVMDGDKDVDPEVLNTDGKIEIEFDRDMTEGYIALQTEAGEDVGWIGKIVGNKGILELVKGREIKGETTYVIRGKVFDADGNALDVSVTFVTSMKMR